MAMISETHHKRLECDAQKYGKTANEKKTPAYAGVFVLIQRG